jgi:diguanylate cyclase (GGDEF)-like protein
MLPQTALPGAVEVAERIRKRMAEETQSDEREVSLTLSIGVAEYPKHGDTTQALIAAADAALYQAKRRGRNRVVRATAQKGESITRARGKQARGRKRS